MRRSASPSKAAGARASPRSRTDDSSAVLRAAFRPLSGLSRPSTSTSRSSNDNGKGKSTASAPSSGVVAGPRSLEELRTELVEADLVLSARLEAHNAARSAKGLPPQDADQVVAAYIALLTQYNRVKDAAELIFDKIAELEQLPSGDIHARYGVGNDPSICEPTSLP